MNKLTKDEITTILEALNTEKRSALRAEKSAKTPAIADCHRLRAKKIAQLETKLQAQ